MTVYTFDHTLDGLLSAVFDAYALRQLPDELLRQGAVLPMFCDEVHEVATTEEKASRVWAGLETGKLNDDVISNDDQLLQDLWRTYFKAICIKERLNPRKQLNDMPRRYWKYMTEKN